MSKIKNFEDFNQNSVNERINDAIFVDETEVTYDGVIFTLEVFRDVKSDKLFAVHKDNKGSVYSPYNGTKIILT